MSKTARTVSKSPPKPPLKIDVLLTGKEIHKGLETILTSQTPLSKAVGDLVLQALWALKCQDDKQQFHFAAAITAFLDAYVGKGGRP